MCVARTTSLLELRIKSTNDIFVFAALLSIGTELTRGEIVNTNASWLATQLTALGFEVHTIEVVDDDRERIIEAIHRLSRHHGVVISTGGLGPTTDDLTAECVARALGVGLVRHEASHEAIRRRYEKAGRVLTSSGSKQADVPDGAEVLSNSAGTAPGFAVHLAGSLLFFLPGVPREVHAIWSDHLEPRLRPLAPCTTHQIRIRTFGLPESQVGDKLQGLEEEFPGLTIGYRASVPEIEVKVHVRADSQDQARTRALAITEVVRQRLGPIVCFGEGDETLAEVTGRAIQARGWRLAIAESCTGGLVGHLFTKHPVSEFFIADAVTYANAAKTRLLGVSEDVLRAHGAVSAEVASAMAVGIRRACEADISLAITGIAGPTGGTPEKPVGLVYLAVAHPGGVNVQERNFTGDRNMIQRVAAHVGLAMLREVAMFPPDLTPRPSSTVMRVAEPAK